MNLFKKKQKKQDGGDWIVKMALQEALRELEEEEKKAESLREDLKIFDKENQKLKEQCNNLERNLEVLQTTIENIKKMCKDKNGRVISSKEILKELGE